MAEYSPVPQPGFIKLESASLFNFTGFDPNVPSRPRSSPSTFGPSQDELLWTSNPLRISHPSIDDGYFTGPTYPPSRAMSPRYEHLGGGIADVRAPTPRRPYAPIAPNPAGLVKMNEGKRPREEEETSEGSAKRRKRSSSSALPVEIGEEDKLLFKLKDDESLPWKDIAARFHSELGKTFQVPALQMRYKRLRERLRVWSEIDVTALRLAHDYWERSKFEIISQKMLEFGASEKWSPKHCARKWAEIMPINDPVVHVPTPAFSHASMSQLSSPVDGPPYVSFFSTIP
ncbi:hypothetical protein M501DRAFT_944979 [Patellaria atrata CBS 101060]|uniref:Myb-like domain-containing protein n=1 Tax=Patellaria atrata CBS 101060 TaxID=1346257 RepID=A0A9P4S1X8_9PEZI|nr:hypothetical protein M501DRAFT_944979 [Patellaria atrata CBS 101060]